MQEVLKTKTDFERDGFAIYRCIVPEEQIQLLAEAVESARKKKSAPGLRNLLNQCPAVKEFAISGIAFTIAKNLLGCDPRPVRGILFDKTLESNWYVTCTRVSFKSSCGSRIFALK